MTRQRLFGLVVAPLPLVSLAAAAGLLAPSSELARRSDLILAALVLAVAVTIEPSRLRFALRRARLLAAAVLLPFVVLLPLALALGRAFEAPERDGLLALGLASSEVAAAALVALAAGDAALALAVVAFSLVASALAAPALTPLLADSRVDVLELVVRFSLVVVVPLVAGVLVRASARGAVMARYGEGASVVILALLVYASLGELGSLTDLGPAILASLAFLGVSLLAAVVLRPLLGEFRTGGLVFSLRDFAVAATLASQIGATGAAVTPAVYGVLMLLVAAGLASLLSRRERASACGRQRRRRTRVRLRVVSIEENKALVNRLVHEGVNQRDPDVLDQVADGQFARIARRWVSPFQSAFPDFRMEIVDLIAEGDTVVAHFKCSGTHQGEWLGVAPTGRRFENVDEIYIFRVKDGKLSSAIGVEDNLTRMRQLGLQPA